MEQIEQLIQELEATEVGTGIYAWEMNGGTAQSFYVSARVEDLLTIQRDPNEGWLIWPPKAGTNDPDNRSHCLESWWLPNERATYQCACGKRPHRPGVNNLLTPHCEGANVTLVTLELPSGKVVPA